MPMPIPFADIGAKQKELEIDKEGKREHICYHNSQHISNCSIKFLFVRAYEKSCATFKCTHFSFWAALMNMSHIMSNSHYKS